MGARGTPVRQRPSALRSAPSLQPGRLSALRSLFLSRTLHAPRRQGQALPETAASSGAPRALPNGTERPGEIHPAGSWPRLAPSSHTVRLCRHLSLSMLEDGGTAPSGRHGPTGGLLFRGPACGSTPYPVTSSWQFLVPQPDHLS